MSAFAVQLKKDYPNNFSPDWTLQLVPMTTVLTGKIRPALLMLLGAVGFVLLIACANVANLLLARAASRRREIAIRTALGARPWDLVRQLLVESLMLSLAGGALGLLIAYGGIKALIASNPANRPRVQDLSIDSSVLLFTLAVAVFTGIVFGLAPALQTWKANLHATLKEGSRTGTADKQGHLMRRGLVVAEIALALTLLTGGGLLLKSFGKLSNVSPGFTPGHLVTFGVALPAAKYKTPEQQIAFWDAVYPRLAQVPGVQAVGGTSVIPFGGGWATNSFNIEGYTPPPNANSPWGDIRVVSPGFLRTLQVPLVQGRMFTDQDDANAVRVALVDEEFVHRYYKPGENAIGKRIYFGAPTPDSSTRYMTIVGVVGHAKHEGLDADPRIQYYLPVAQTGTVGGMGRMDVLVRTGGDPLRLTGAIRGALHEVDPDLPDGAHPYHGRHGRRHHGSAASLDHPARHLCRSRTPAGLARHLRRHVVRCSTTHEGTRRSHGAGSLARQCARTRAASGCGADPARRRDRAGGCIRAHPASWRAAVQREADRSGDIRRRHGTPARRLGRCDARSGIAGDARQPDCHIAGGMRVA